MAKVLISSLGTGTKKDGMYQKATYKSENQKMVKSISYPYDKYFQTQYKGSTLDIRNNIAHQLDARSDSIGRDTEKLKFFIDEFKTYFQKEGRY